MESIQVAKYIINLAIKFEKPISNLQLQKIMYFVHLDFLRKTGEKLITDKAFEAWQLGPVIKDVYFEYRIFGSNKISAFEKGGILNLEATKLEMIDTTVKKSIALKPWELVEKSHIKGGAWEKIFKNGEGDRYIIPDYLIQEEANANLWG